MSTCGRFVTTCLALQGSCSCFCGGAAQFAAPPIKAPNNGLRQHASSPLMTIGLPNTRVSTKCAVGGVAGPAIVAVAATLWNSSCRAVIHRSTSMLQELLDLHLSRFCATLGLYGSVTSCTCDSSDMSQTLGSVEVRQRSATSHAVATG